MSSVMMCRNVFLLLIFVISVTSQRSSHSRRIGTEGQIVSRVLSDYDPVARPPIRGCTRSDSPFIICFKDTADHSAILVIANIFINRVRWHDERAEVDLYLRQQWEDGRLRYDVDPREELNEVRIPENRKIWKPDTYITSANEISKGEHQTAFVEPSGFVRASEKRTVDVPFNYGVNFPYINTRQFTLRLGSYNYPIEDVVYLWANSPPLVNPVEVSNDLLGGSIKFEEANAGDCVGNYTVGVYSCVDVIVTFSSCSTSALFSWFFPSLFLVFASWLHFFVHGSWSVPRTFSAALPFFIFAALFVFRKDLVSNGSQSIWFSFCLIITFLSFVEYFLVICCGIRRSIRYSTNGHPEEHPIGTAKETLEMAYDTRCASFRNNSGLDYVSRIAFPLVFFIFSLIFYIFWA